MAPTNIEQLLQISCDKRVTDALSKCFEEALNKRLASIDNCLQTLMWRMTMMKLSIFKRKMQPRGQRGQRLKNKVPMYTCYGID